MNASSLRKCRWVYFPMVMVVLFVLAATAHGETRFIRVPIHEAQAVSGDGTTVVECTSDSEACGEAVLWKSEV